MPPIRHASPQTSLPPVRGFAPYHHRASERPYQAPGQAAGVPGPCGAHGGHGVARGDGAPVPDVLPAAVAHEARPDAAAGRRGAANADPRVAPAPGHADQDPDPHGLAEQWECLLEKLRGPGGAAAAPEGGACGRVVDVQPAHGVLREQAHRTAVTPLWVVNPMDWIDVEYVLRRMLQCESTECHHFHTVGYIFFRSCALTHVTHPSPHQPPAVMRHRFHDVGIAVEITRAHPEGVLEVTCFAEYDP